MDLILCVWRTNSNHITYPFMFYGNIKREGERVMDRREKESKPPLYPVKDLALISAFQFSSITCSCFSLYVLHDFLFYFIEININIVIL